MIFSEFTYIFVAIKCVVLPITLISALSNLHPI